MLPIGNPCKKDNTQIWFCILSQSLSSNTGSANSYVTPEYSLYEPIAAESVVCIVCFIVTLLFSSNIELDENGLFVFLLSFIRDLACFVD